MRRKARPTCSQDFQGGGGSYLGKLDFFCVGSGGGPFFVLLVCMPARTCVVHLGPIQHGPLKN